MRVSTTSTITCPRCHVPVEGDFKYCPECAFRLRPGPPVHTHSPAPTRRGTVLVVLAVAALLSAGIFVGRQVHTPPVIELIKPHRAQLRVVDIQDHLASIPTGLAEWTPAIVFEGPPDEEAAEHFLDVLGAATEEDNADTRFRDALFAETLADNPLPLTHWSRILSLAYRHSDELVHELEDHEGVYTFPASMMRYEVTRGQWREFLEAALGDPSQMGHHAFVAELWRPALKPAETYEARLGYSRGHWLHWWGAVLDAYLSRHASLPFDERPPLPKRPAWLPKYALPLGDGVTGITEAQGAMLLIPPQWVRVTADGQSISWHLEEGTEDLPITGVSWWDVKMFITWAVKYLGNPHLALPNWGEWQRAFHGGYPPRAPDDIDEIGEPERYPWPWGDEPRPALCNNLHYGTEDNPAALRSVRMTYPTGNGGLTLERLHNMSGNAAEWTDNYELLRQDGRTWANQSPPIYGSSKFLGANRVCGGSYLSGLDECRASSSETLDKRAHQDHVGFRLIVRQHKFGE